MIYVIEGLDYTGKSTILKGLGTLLPNFYTNEYPDYASTSGKTIRLYYNGSIDLELPFVESLLESNRGETVGELNSHENSILSRFSLSGVVYRLSVGSSDVDMTTKDYALYVEEELHRQLKREYTNHGTPKPDVIFYLDTTADEVNEWIKLDSDRDMDRRESLEIQRKVERNYNIALNYCSKLGISVYRIPLTKTVRGEKVRISSNRIASDIGRNILNGNYK